VSHKGKDVGHILRDHEMNNKSSFNLRLTSQISTYELSALGSLYLKIDALLADSVPERYC